MTQLYILEDGAFLSIDGGTFKIEYKDGLIKKLPKESVESIIMLGKSQISTQCICEFLERGIPVSYLSKTGKYFGRLESTSHRNIKREKIQISQTENEDYSLKISKKFISGKINNQIVLLRKYRYLKENLINANVKQMMALHNKALIVESIEELIGYEGMVSRIYFETISNFIKSDFKFVGRSKRPPKDPFNSMLSFGYTILLYVVYEAIQSRGLNPYAGFLHKDKERHPTLASDLMEEFRPVLIDAPVLSLIQGNEISIDDFEVEIETGGVIISKDGIKKLVEKINKKLESKTIYFDNQNNSYRRGIWIQVGKLMNSLIENDVDLYEALKVR